MAAFTRRTLGDEDYALLKQGIGIVLVEGGEPYWANRYRPVEVQCSNYRAWVQGREESYQLSFSARREDESGWGASYPRVFRLDQLEEAARIGERYLQEMAAGAGWLFKVEVGGPHYAITYCDEHGVAHCSWPIARSFTSPVSDAAGATLPSLRV